MELYILHLKIKMMRKRLAQLVEDRGKTHPLVLAVNRRINQLVAEFHRKAGQLI